MAEVKTIARVFENYGFYNNNELSSKKVNRNISSVLFKYKWLIQLKYGLPNIPEKLISPEFPNRANSEITWYLRTEFSKLGVGVNLSLASCNGRNVNATYRFILRNSRGKPITNWVGAPKRLFKLNDISNVIHIVYPEKRWRPDGVRIDCEITVLPEKNYPAQNRNISIKELNSVYSIQSSISANSIFQFAEELQTMFENEEFSDVTFSIQGQELKAHKVILAAGSSAFRVMFEQDMMEKKHNRVEITDVDFEVFRELIRYIYTNQVSNLDEIAKDLLIASDKYDLEKLKSMSESFLCNNISTENVIEMFIFADTHKAVFLKDEAKEYIVSNSKDVSDTAGWQVMITTHPHLVAEAFIALSKKMPLFVA